MYEVDGRDRVRKVDDVPRFSVGAPLPFLLGEESRLVLGYFAGPDAPAQAADVPLVSSAGAKDDLVGIILFEGVWAQSWGPPNDEVAHRLYDRGLRPYGMYEVANSTWIRRLEEMNRVHPHHQRGLFSRLRHFVLSFHDSTFECCCQRYSSRIIRGSITECMDQMVATLRGEGELG